MIDNNTKTVEFSRLGGLDPKWMKMKSKLSILSIWAALAQNDRNGSKTFHFDHLGGLGPKWSKMTPKLSILTIWAALARNV